MTREEKLQQFAEQYTKGLYLDRHNLIQMVKAGAEWADQHPQWIPVEDYEKDELPSLMDKEDQYGCSVSVLFVVNLDGINYINKGCFDYDTGVWHSIDTGLSYTKEQVTHWMPIVPPRKEDKE